jgi:hypothetical protein
MMEAARREGWRVEVSVSEGKISISATSPDGSGFHFACAENKFIERLHAALLKTRPN